MAWTNLFVRASTRLAENIKMLREMCKAKIQSATVTETNINYTGSITIDKTLLEAVNILRYERVQILNINNGMRIETYVIEGERDSGIVCLNGAAARWAEPGDRVIIISYCLIEDEKAKDWQPKIIFVNEKNRINKETKKAKRQKGKKAKR